jgi:hypothetical protein
MFQNTNDFIPTTVSANDQASVIFSFLKWIRNNKNIHFCEPYKKQYDWYTPVPYTDEALLYEFLDQLDAVFEQQEQESQRELSWPHIHKE